jgi:hypothetical protein
MAKKVKRLAWSSEDVRSPKSFAKARMSGPQIAQKLKRTPRAVSQKAFASAASFLSPTTNGLTIRPDINWTS